MEQLTYRQFWRKWTFRCGLGEMLSMAVAASIAVAYNYSMGEPESLGAGALNMLVMLGAGAIEGFILGWAQWSVLRLKYTYLKAEEWIGYTMAVAILGWALGMIPSMFSFNTPTAKNVTQPITPIMPNGTDSLFLKPNFQVTETITTEPSLLWILLGAAAMGLLLGALFGLFQWFALRKHSSQAKVWILANSVAWAVGMVWIFLAATLPDASTPIPLIVGMGAAGGILAGLSVGAITGWFLMWIPVDDLNVVK